MRQSLQALLRGVIDYAGLFPPSRLPVEQAIRNYARYRTQAESWMLGRFICPAAALAELAPFSEELFSEEYPCPLSVLGRSGETARDFLTNLRADLHDILALLDRFDGLFTVGVLEVRLPGVLLSADGPEPIEQLITESQQLLEGDGLADVRLFLEVPLRKSWQVEVDKAVTALQTFTGEEACPPPGIKLRCGGIEASAFPSPEQLAFAIEEAAADQVPLKFTAGLHHPIRRHDSALNCDMHGFLNVLTASVLAYVHGVNHETLRTVLEDRVPEGFTFEDDRLGWGDRTVNRERIGAVRQQAGLSFGSCSFDEPREDLRSLGLL
jgi:hypothetical protein